MIRPDVTDMIGFLNELLWLDPDFVTKLVNKRFPCNDAILNHPTVQVTAAGEPRSAYDTDPDVTRTGFLGVLNGYFGVYDDGTRKNWGAICCETDDRTGAVLRFYQTPNEPVTEPDGSGSVEGGG